MKNSQLIIRLILFLFFGFGIFQTAYSQTIDEQSKAVLDKVEAHYSSFESMIYKAKFMIDMETEFEETMEIVLSMNRQYIKIDTPEGILVTDGESTTHYDKIMEVTEKMPFDENMNILWFPRMAAFCQKNANVTFVESTEFNDQAVEIIKVECLDEEDGFGLVEMYISTKTSEIIRFVVTSEDNAIVEFSDFEANPTFEDNHFEIKK